MKKAPVLVFVAVILIFAAAIVALLGERSQLINRLDSQTALQQEREEKMLADADNQAAMSEQNEMLLQENASLFQQLEAAQEELQSSKAEAQNALQQLETLQAEYQQKLDAAHQENDMLSGIHQELNNEIANQMDTNQQVLLDAQKTLEQLELANVQLNEKLAASEEENTQLKEKLAACEEENAQLKEKLAAFEEEGTQLNEKLAGYENEIARLNTELEALAAKAEAVPVDVDLTATALGDAPVLFPENAAETAVLAASVPNDAESPSPEVVAENDALKAQVAELTAAVADFEDQLYQANEDNALLQETIAQFADMYDQQAKALNALRASVEGQSEEPAMTSRALDELYADNDRLTQLCEELQAQLKPVQDEAEALRAENLELKEQLAPVQAELESLRAKSLEQQEQDQQSHQDAEALRAENLELRDQLQALTQEIEASRAEPQQQENTEEAVAPTAETAKVDKLFITCVNKYNKKTYFKVTLEEALMLEIAPGTKYVTIELIDDKGNIIPF